MLWTDSIFVSPSDLLRTDSEVDAVADSEDIQLSGANGLIRSAYEEVTDELNKNVVAFGGYLGSGDVTPNHLAAVLNVGLGNAVRQKCLPCQVVVNGDVPGSWNHMKRWAVYFVLELFYRDAYNRTVKDRYQGKMRYYRSERQRRIEPTMKGRGIPIVVQPLVRPAAAYEQNSGSWGTANVSTVPLPGTAGGIFDVAITYVNPSPGFYVGPTVPKNAESHPSDTIRSVTVPAGSVLNIDISSLNPPLGIQPLQQILLCVIQPLAATQWNVYAGVTGGTLYLQNTVPIPISQTSYSLPSDPRLSGFSVQQGQVPQRFLSLVPSRQRA